MLPLDRLLHTEPSSEADVPQSSALVLRRAALLTQLDVLDERIDAAERCGAAPSDLINEREYLIARLEDRNL